MADETVTNADDSDATALIQTGLNAAKKLETQVVTTQPVVTAAAPAEGTEATPPDVVAPTEGDELKQLRDKVAQLESSQNARGQELEAEYTKGRFILQNCQDIPIAISEKFLPVSSDQATLTKSAGELRDALKLYVQQANEAAKKRPDFGVTPSGGFPPGDARGMSRPNQSGVEMISAGLVKRR